MRPLISERNPLPANSRHHPRGSVRGGDITRREGVRITQEKRWSVQYIRGFYCRENKILNLINRLTAILRSIDFILLIKSSCEDKLISSKYKLSLNLNTANYLQIILLQWCKN